MTREESKDYQPRLNPTDVTIVTGHYGSGKTNFAMNLSMAYQAMGKDVSLCDIDIVNPYFRSADFAPLCEQHGIHLITPPFANTNLDTPILTRQVDGAISSGCGPRTIPGENHRTRKLPNDIGGQSMPPAYRNSRRRGSND